MCNPQTKVFQNDDLRRYIIRDVKYVMIKFDKEIFVYLVFGT